MIQPGKYRHYKGREYEVLGVVLHTKNREPMVHYRALYEVGEYDRETYGEELQFVRPLAMWLEKVEVNGTTVERFKFIEER